MSLTQFLLSYLYLSVTLQERLSLFWVPPHPSVIFWVLLSVLQNAAACFLQILYLPLHFAELWFPIWDFQSLSSVFVFQRPKTVLVSAALLLLQSNPSLTVGHLPALSALPDEYSCLSMLVYCQPDWVQRQQGCQVPVSVCLYPVDTVQSLDFYSVQKCDSPRPFGRPWKHHQSCPADHLLGTIYHWFG